jgi:hypothetical protein
MSQRRPGVTLLCAFVAATLVALVPLAAEGPEERPPYSFATPVFGLAVGPNDSLLVADAGAGVVALKDSRGKLIVPLPGAADMATTRDGLLVITGGGMGESAARLWRVVKGQLTEVADLGAFEATVNPDGQEVNPNPFDVAALPHGRALVADAGGNSLLLVESTGEVDWIATLPQELVSTDNIKQLFDCPAGPPDICEDPPVGLPAMIPAQPVATSVAVGPDGYYYVGELKGFPAPTGASRVWRINPEARHAQCGSSPDCTVVASGFTSIVDLAFGPDGRLYVVELDEASWFAVEVTGTPIGGTVNECTSAAGTWSCAPRAGGLLLPIAAAVDAAGTVHVATKSLVPGEAEIVTLP